MPEQAQARRFLAKLRDGIVASEHRDDDLIVCAISGGCDSTALLVGLYDILNGRESVIAAHFNHRLRGIDSDLDEASVRELCSELDIDLRVGHLSDEDPDPSENAAREARYRFLADVSASIGAKAVAVAHTLEDQAETVLLRIARGTGIRGVAAMSKRRVLHIQGAPDPIVIIRPMLETTHDEAKVFLQARGIAHRHDASNDDWTRYARNRIRHRVLPELVEINPDAVASIARFAQNAHVHLDLIDTLVDGEISRIVSPENDEIDRAELIALHPALSTELLTRLHQNVVEPGFHLKKSHIEKMLNLSASSAPAHYHLPGSATFETDPRSVRIAKSSEVAKSDSPSAYVGEDAVLKIPGALVFGDAGTLVASQTKPPIDFSETSRDEAWLSPDLLDEENLIVRTRREGDRFQPLGMKDEIKLQDFFVNSKIPRLQRDRVPIVASSKSGRIAWIVGCRPAEWAKLMPHHRECLHIEMRRKESA